MSPQPGCDYSVVVKSDKDSGIDRSLPGSRLVKVSNIVVLAMKVCAVTHQHSGMSECLMRCTILQESLVEGFNLEIQCIIVELSLLYQECGYCPIAEVIIALLPLSSIS